MKKNKNKSQIRALVALTRASILSSFRNKTSLFFNFLFPLIFITIFGLINLGSTSFDIGVKSESVKSGPFYEAISKVTSFNLLTDRSDSQLQDDLQKGRIPAVISIQKSETQVSPTIKIPVYKVDIEKSGASPQGAETVGLVIENLVNKINTSPAVVGHQLVTTNFETVAGKKLKQIDFVLPGMLAFALLSNALIGMSFVMVVMKKELIIKRLFATPVRKYSILLSEMVGKLLIALIQALFIVLFGYFVFHYILAHGLVTIFGLMVLSLIGTITFLSFGLLIASIANNEDSVSPLANIIMMPQLFFAGTFFPIDAFPKWLQPIAHVLPMTFLNEAFKKVAFEGQALSSTLPQIGALALWAVVTYAVVIFLFKWE